MDKINLDNTQLQYLRTFIRQRGVKEPDMIHEILDHFACKVEELLTADPLLPWEKVVKMAHHSFGPTGFRPLIAAYEESLSHELWQSYRAALKQTVLAPSVLFAISAGISLSGAYRWFSAHLPAPAFLDAADYLYLGVLLLWAVLRLFTVRFNPRLKTQRGQVPALWQKKARSLPELPLISSLFGTLFFNHQALPAFIPWVYGFMCTATLISLVAQWKVIRYAARKYGPGMTAPKTA